MIDFNLPQAVTLLIEKVDNIQALIEQKTKQQDEILTIEEAGAFLSLSLPTMYNKSSKRELPFMKRGKRLYFSRNELIEYLEKGKVKIGGR